MRGAIKEFGKPCDGAFFHKTGIRMHQGSFQTWNPAKAKPPIRLRRVKFSALGDPTAAANPFENRIEYCSHER